jgi:hypothetical protein
MPEEAPNERRWAMMHLTRLNTAVSIVLAILLSWAQAESKDERLSLAAHVVTGYTSLCDVEPQQQPKSATIDPGAGYSFSMGCRDFNQRSLVPIEIVVTNLGSQPAKFRVPLLSEVSFQLAQRPTSAVAFYVPWGSRTGFATEVTGVIEVVVDPGQSVGFVYLLPKPAEQAVLRVQNYPAISLKK